MSISVVTVALNASLDASLTIESVIQQDFEEMEYIFVDGGSTDGTSEVLRRYRHQIDRIVRLEDAGIYYAMNLALDYCRKEYVLFLNAGDTLFNRETLKRMMLCCEAKSDIFYGNHIYVDGCKEYLRNAMPYDVLASRLHRGAVDHHWLSHIPGHQATFVKTSLLQRLKFDTDLLICADHDLMIRAFHDGARFQYIDECVSHYVGGGFSAQNSKRLALEWAIVYRRYSVNPNAVDRFFLGEIESPFGYQSASTGVVISGDYQREHIQITEEVGRDINWCRPDTLVLRTPERGSYARIFIEGYCPFEDQNLFFLFCNRTVAELKLKSGWFQEEVEFTEIISSDSIVEIVALKAGDVSNIDTRIVGYAIHSFVFSLVSDTSICLNPGDRLIFSEENQSLTSGILGAGWSWQEKHLIWSIGETATLRLKLAEDVKEIQIHCKGNPFIAEKDLRAVDVFMNSSHILRYSLPIDNGIISILRDIPQKEEVIVIQLHPVCRLAPPNDSRMLGVGLLSVHLL